MKKNKSALAKKLAEVKGTRDLWGRLTYLAATMKDDLSRNMEKVLLYPLVPNPPPLSHFDGSMRKTEKAKFTQKLESMVDTDLPADLLDTIVIDALFLLRTLTSLSRLLQDVTRLILKIAVK